MTPTRTIEEWRTYALDAPIEAKLVERGRDPSTLPESFVDAYTAQSSSSFSSSVSGGGGLPKPGTVADLLLELSNSSPASSAAAHLDPLNGLATHEVHDMFTAQSKMLREMLTSTTTLREEWLRSKEKLLLGPEVDEQNAITLGEAHVLVELQLANQDLRAQLDRTRAQLDNSDRRLRTCQASNVELQNRCDELKAELEASGGGARST
eukprot:FR744111.1.p1 GENE.FR744111.1~~FR744111.1.p1  ORF type:complete len:241 (+),score=17.92 FR744111.1:102-725(+)